MPDRIRLLPDVVANQIAAGEVVNNPSSVVKEMMENAVDAGATSVTVNFREGGMQLIQVVDNGCGMSPIDARMAFDRHATSKIRNAEDIYDIATFGFRGEALASIAAVAEVEVRTRQKGEQVGTSVEVSGGTFRAQNAMHCTEGTQFLVRNLFYNIPARKRFLEDTSKEARRVREEFRRVALCYPEIEFQLFDNNAPIYNLPSTNLRSRIVGVIGKNIAGNLLEVNADTSLVHIEGFVGRPAASKKNNTEQYLFINGRYFKSAYFHKAIMDVYEKLIPLATKPSYFLYLHIDPQRVDVNVHPQKTEVKFEDGPALRQIINAAVRESLAKTGALPMMDFDMDTSVEIPVHRGGIAYKNPEIKPNPDFNPFGDTVWEPQAQYAVGGTNGGTSGRIGGGEMSGGTNDYENFALYPSVMDDSQTDISLIEYIEGDDAWQSSLEIDAGHVFSAPLAVGSRYCAATLGNELVIIDIRRAWEAVLYHRYAGMIGSGAAASQGLLFPQSVSLSMEDCASVRGSREEFYKLGFNFTIPDENTVLISAVPADFTDTDPGELLREMIPALDSHEASPEQIRAQHLAAVLARAGAAPRSSTHEAALAELLEALAASPEGNYTPSGARVILRITQDEIKRRL